jgi:WD domain, G-beta repeat
VTTGPLGLPRAVAGNFAVTYQLKTSQQQWAVRCFHREAADRASRYAAISAALAQLRGEALVPIDYLDQGVRVGQAWYPVTKMPWVEGFPLNRAVEANLSKPRALQDYERRFIEIVDNLRRRGIAHGDLQHGNILVDRAGNLHLVDYDGMFVPALRGRAASESGDPNYQHPRRAAQFDTELDRFAVLVIVVALRALAASPRLWQAYNTGDNLLFRRTDFADPGRSPLFRDLAALPEVAVLAKRLAQAAEGDYASVPLLDEILAPPRAATPKPAPTPVAPKPLTPAHVAMLNALYGPDKGARKAPRTWKLSRATVQEALAFSRDGTQLACAQRGGRITLRQVDSGRTLRSLRLPRSAGPLRAITFSPQGCILAVTSDGPRLVVWNAAEQRPLNELEWSGHVTGLALSSDGRSLAGVGARGTVLVQSARGISRVAIGRRVSCLAFTQDGSLLLLGTADGRVRGLDTRSGALLAEFARIEAPLASLALAPDGCTLAAAGRDGSLWLRRVPRAIRPVAEPPRVWRLFDWLKRVALL